MIRSNLIFSIFEMMPPKSKELSSKTKLQNPAPNTTGGRGISMPAVSVIQNMEEHEIIQEKIAPIKPAMQFVSSSDDESQLGSNKPFQLKPNNTGLPDNLKSGIENLSDMNMDHVRVHYNSSKPAQLNALAYAQGSDIHIASGQEKHLPHEAWHVVQQAQGRVQAAKQMKAGVTINDDPGLEHEADVMGEKANNVQRYSMIGRNANLQSVSSSGSTMTAQLVLKTKSRVVDNTSSQYLKSLIIDGKTYLSDEGSISSIESATIGDAKILSPFTHVIGEYHSQSKFSEAQNSWGWGARSLHEGGDDQNLIQVASATASTYEPLEDTFAKNWAGLLLYANSLKSVLQKPQEQQLAASKQIAPAFRAASLNAVLFLFKQSTEVISKLPSITKAKMQFLVAQASKFLLEAGKLEGNKEDSNVKIFLEMLPGIPDILSEVVSIYEDLMDASEQQNHGADLSYPDSKPSIGDDMIKTLNTTGALREEYMKRHMDALPRDVPSLVGVGLTHARNMRKWGIPYLKIFNDYEEFKKSTVLTEATFSGPRYFPNSQYSDERGKEEEVELNSHDAGTDDSVSLQDSQQLNHTNNIVSAEQVSPYSEPNFDYLIIPFSVSNSIFFEGYDQIILDEFQKTTADYNTLVDILKSELARIPAGRVFDTRVSLINASAKVNAMSKMAMERIPLDEINEELIDFQNDVMHRRDSILARLII
jgi:hypothetical protein